MHIRLLLILSCEISLFDYNDGCAPTFTRSPPLARLASWNTGSRRSYQPTALVFGDDLKAAACEPQSCLTFEQ